MTRFLIALTLVLVCIEALFVMRGVQAVQNLDRVGPERLHLVDHYVVADLPDLDSATRKELSRDEATRDPIWGALSPPRIVQVYVPRPGHSRADVIEELWSVADLDGWEQGDVEFVGCETAARCSWITAPRPSNDHLEAWTLSATERPDSTNVILTLIG